MKRILTGILAILVTAGLLITPSCTTEDPTTGILVITVMNEFGELIVGEEVFLATSYQNLKNKIYVVSAWTDDTGEAFFANLAPGYYWYDTANWEDYGATQVYAGIEHYVILWVNTPPGKK
jgi:hypothetical protein